MASGQGPGSPTPVAQKNQGLKRVDRPIPFGPTDTTQGQGSRATCRPGEYLSHPRADPRRRKMPHAPWISRSRHVLSHPVTVMPSSRIVAHRAGPVACLAVQVSYTHRPGRPHSAYLVHEKLRKPAAAEGQPGRGQDPGAQGCRRKSSTARPGCSAVRIT